MAAFGTECPSRVISSRVVAPAMAACVATKWRRSCQRSFGSPAVSLAGKYTVYSVALNARGDSSPSAPTASLAARRLPGKVAGLKVTVTGTTFSIRWGAASGNGAAISRCSVQVVKGGGGYSKTFSASGSALSVTGLPARSSYKITVSAINAAGTGASTSATATIR